MKWANLPMCVCLFLLSITMEHFSCIQRVRSLIAWPLRKGGKNMDAFLFILKYLMQGSLIIGGALLTYWFQYTDEGKKHWERKIKRLNGERSGRKGQGGSKKKARDITRFLKEGSLLLKISLSLFGIFLVSLLLMGVVVFFL